MRYLACALAVLAFSPLSVASDEPSGRPAPDDTACVLSAADRQAVAAVSREYIAAWRANDPDRVAAVLADDAVMLPHHGEPPREGKDAILDWWFPGGEVSAKVLSYEITLTETGGCGDLAFDRGRLVELSWEYGGRVYRNGDGNFMTLYRREPDGTWLIVRRIWNDPLPRVDDD